MTTKTKQLLLFSICFGVTLLLFLLGNTKTPIEKSSVQEAKNLRESKESFEKVEELALSKLSASKRDTIKKILNVVNTSDTTPKKVDMLDSLANTWLNYGNPDMNAFYTLKKAETSKEKNHLFEGLAKAQTASQLSPDSLAKSYFIDKTLAIYTQLSSEFPDSLQYSIQKASILIDQKQQVMQGVMILRDVIQKDSLNLQANFILGKLSVVSGQFEKAEKRLETVLKQDAKNTEALYFLGEAYVGLEKKDKAIETFNKCKELVDSPVFKQEIDKYINKIIKQ